MTNLKLVSIFGLISSSWVFSFAIHPHFKTLELGLYDSKQERIEFFPDILVTYHCAKFKKLKGLDMQSNEKTVTVNYGGFGRRRGLQTFTCLDNL